MKICEKCGKEIHSNDDLFTRMGLNLCEKCACEFDKMDATEKNIFKKNMKSKIDAKNLIMNSSNPWIKIMKTLTIIELIIMLIASIPIALSVSDVTYSGGMGFLAFIVTIIVSIATTSLTMVFLNLAEDVSILKAIAYKNLKEKNN